MKKLVIKSVVVSSNNLKMVIYLSAPSPLEKGHIAGKGHWYCTDMLVVKEIMTYLKRT